MKNKLCINSEKTEAMIISLRPFIGPLTLLPIGGGGGGGGELFGPHHHTGSQNSRTLSPRVSKISDFFFMPFGHIVAKFQVD